MHRFNKGQQDAFLPHVESGLFTFIGATTENPSFEVNSALLSRAAVYVLQPLSEPELKKIVDVALDKKALGAIQTIAPEAIDRLAAYADGDARRLLNTLESVAVAAANEKSGALIEITDAWLLKVLGEKMRRYDKGGEVFYDTISALHKSVRGSDPDAALYWFVRMLDGGAEPKYMARRLIRMASEDIGLADPRALSIAVTAADVYDRLGSPEGELADYGKNYRYAHDEEDGFAAGENYFPQGLTALDFYRPVSRGLEIKISEKLQALRLKNAKHT